VQFPHSTQSLIRPLDGGLGDQETAQGKKYPCDLVVVKPGGSPGCGELVMVRRVRHTMAAEVAEMRQGAEEKSGCAGTWQEMAGVADSSNV